MIEVHFDTSIAELDASEIVRVLEAAMAMEGVDLDLSIAIVTDKRIQEINREFLGHDWPTDVVTFDLTDDFGGPDAELVVSADTARREALARGAEVDAELLLYCVHGLLHLLDYDDLDPVGRRRMMVRQAQILSELGHHVTLDDELSNE
ncbi:MAG: rRNA maturation RNase YbeY [Planctomycetes bacterium]|nr:rRNA maturation RNase YbeY [Planctomycetota bacterium]